MFSDLRAILGLILFFVCLIDIQGQCPLTVEADGDTTLCSNGGQVQLHGEITSGDPFDFFWEPPFLVDDPNSTDPIATISSPTILYFTARCLGNNLIVNGDFEQGNTGFTSSYIYSPTNLFPEGTYAVLTNPNSAHTNFAPCDDHTSGNGQMMVVNGETTPNEEVWCQTINVDPGTDYVFETWVTTVVASNPAQLQFSINGILIGNVFTAPSTNCVWEQFNAVWNSGGNVTADICITNQNTIASGNDFAIDDMFFGPLTPFTDSVIIDLAPNSESWVDTLICPGYALIIDGDSYSQPGTYDILLEGANSRGCDSLIHLTIEHREFMVSLQTNGFIDCFNPVTTIQAEVTPFDPNLTFNWSTNDGNIVNGQGTSIIGVDQEGTYTLVVTYDDGVTSCSADPVEVFIEDRSETPEVFIQEIPVITCDGLPHQIIAGTNSISFSASWTTLDGNIVIGENTLEPWVDSDGTYSLYFLDLENGCDTTLSVIVERDVDLPTAVILGDDLLDCQTTSLFLDGSSSVPTPLAYEWIHAESGYQVLSTDLLFEVFNPGTYILKVTNPLNNCMDTTSIIIVKDTFIPDLNLPDSLWSTCKTPNPGISINLLPDTSLYSFTWLPPLEPSIAEDSFFFEMEGEYVVEIMSKSNHCATRDSIIIIKDTLIPSFIPLVDSVLTCNISEITYSLHFSMQTTFNNIIWQNSAGVTIGNSSSQTIQTGDLYRVNVKDSSNGCVSSDTFQVEDLRDLPGLQLKKSNDLNCRDQSSRIHALSEDSTILNYLWTPTEDIIAINERGDIITTDQPGTFTVVIIDTITGCTNQDTITVSQLITIPEIQLDSFTTVTCANPGTELSATIISSNPYWISWSSADGEFLTAVDENPVQILGPAIYSIEVTDTVSHCKDSKSIAVTSDDDLPEVNAGPDTVLTCSVMELNLNGSSSESGPGYIHWWSTLDGNIVSGDSSFQPLINTSGKYTLHSISPINGCTNQQSVFVDWDTISPGLQIEPPSQLTCNRDSSELIANIQAGMDLIWSTSNGVISGDPQSLSVFAKATGVYVVNVTNPKNGCQQSGSIEVTEDIQSPQGIPIPPESLNCMRDEVPLAFSQLPNRPHIFNWLDPQGNPVGSTNLAMIFANQPGQWSVEVVFEDNGCSSQFLFDVPIDTIFPVAIAGADQTLSCVNLATLDGTGSSFGSAFSVEWTGPSGSIIQNPMALNPVVNLIGIYQIIVIDELNGCESKDEVEVLEPANLEFTVGFEDPTCSDPYGQIEIIQVSGGNPPITVTIEETNQTYTENDLPALVPGNYTLELEDVDGCKATETIEIPDTTGITVNLPDLIELEPNEQVVLIPQLSISEGQVETVIWTSSPSLNCHDCLQPVLTGMANESLQIQITSEEGCKASDIMQITLVVNPQVYIPNAFSPNGDLINDVFRAYPDGSIVQIKSFQIYNRWGGRVFEASNTQPDDPFAAWDGSMNGKILNPGVFVYHITLVDILGGEHFFKGEIHLVD